MIKIIGFIIIVISSSKIGFDLAKKYLNRSRELKAFIYVLERLKSEIGFSNCVITDALINSSNVKNETVKNMINYMAEMVKENNVSLSDAFNKYITNDSFNSFNKTDVDELYKFFSSVGNGDREDEIENINNCIASIKINLRNA
ncbi:MAG: hypothetical protein UH854_00325, partial [Clostridia bacterium]|nr:hypothetical protein [Clostridia bacterium]